MYIIPLEALFYRGNVSFFIDIYSWSQKLHGVEIISPYLISQISTSKLVIPQGDHASVHREK